MKRRMKVQGKAAKAIVQELKKMGIPWTLKPCRSSHYKFVLQLPNGARRIFVASSSTSDVRAALNSVKCLHRVVREATA